TGTGTGTLQFAGLGQVSFDGGGTVSIYYNPTGDSTTVNGFKYSAGSQTDFGVNVTLANGATSNVNMLVNTVYDLQNVQNNLSGRYALGRSIDASVTSGWNSGAGFAPIGTFTGYFDGQGNVIKGLVINRPAQNNVGLFSFLN